MLINGVLTCQLQTSTSCWHPIWHWKSCVSQGIYQALLHSWLTPRWPHNHAESSGSKQARYVQTCGLEKGKPWILGTPMLQKPGLELLDPKPGTASLLDPNLQISMASNKLQNTPGHHSKFHRQHRRLPWMGCAIPLLCLRNEKSSGTLFILIFLCEIQVLLVKSQAYWFKYGFASIHILRFSIHPRFSCSFVTLLVEQTCSLDRLTYHGVMSTCMYAYI